MDRVEIQKHAVENVIQSWLESKRQQSHFSLEFVIDSGKQRFLLIGDGWLNHRRLYGTIIDISLRGGKVWVLEDNTEEGIAEDLLEAGLTRDEIVIAWQPEYRRELTGFAIS